MSKRQAERLVTENYVNGHGRSRSSHALRFCVRREGIPPNRISKLSLANVPGVPRSGRNSPNNVARCTAFATNLDVASPRANVCAEP